MECNETQFLLYRYIVLYGLPFTCGLPARVRPLNFLGFCWVLCKIQVSFLRGDPPEKIQKTVVEKVPKVVTTGWRFWPFVHVVTYFMIPPRHRVLWVSPLFTLRPVRFFCVLMLPGRCPRSRPIEYTRNMLASLYVWHPFSVSAQCEWCPPLCDTCH